jgi:hypothetical protein
MICSHDGADPLDAVQVTVAINLSAEEVPWESSPEGADWLANELRLSKGGFMYFWRSCLDPIWNHYIRGPVRVWSVDDGLHERALTALEARDSESLKRLIPEPADGRLQLREGLGRRWLICSMTRSSSSAMAAQNSAARPTRPQGQMFGRAGLPLLRKRVLLTARS